MNILVITSLLFIINSIVAYSYGHNIYSLLFLLLFISSTLTHSFDYYLFSIIDRIIILSIVFYGGYILYKKNPDLVMLIIIICTFIIVCKLWIYGYMTDDYCFHKESKIRFFYHACMHIIGSIGHHLIVIV
jgi:hypothetical protein